MAKMVQCIVCMEMYREGSGHINQHNNMDIELAILREQKTTGTVLKTRRQLFEENASQNGRHAGSIGHTGDDSDR
ncbi:MAG: hypothetical protein ABIE68_01285 [bacterium]